VFPVPPTPPFSEADARAAISNSTCWADALRYLGYQVKGANYRTLQKWAKRWVIGTDHFDSDVGRRRAARQLQIPLDEVLVENSTYNRFNLKRRLLEGALLEARCELCGQDEHWRGRRMSLVIDHINGVSNDNPPREPADGLPELRRHARHTLRSEPAARKGVAPYAARRSSLGTFATGTAPRNAGAWSRGPHSVVCRYKIAARWSGRRTSS